MQMKFFVAALVAVSLPAASLGQSAPAPQFSAEKFRSHVAFLADDTLEGRRTGERGYDIAAHYVATRFAGLGLKPGGTNGGWYQQVPFLEYQPGKTPARLSIGGQSFAFGKDFLTGASPLEPQQSIEAPVVFVGYGLDAPSHGLNDYAGLDVKGKIVAVLGGFPKGTPSEVGAHLNAEKAKTAQGKGAIGMITIRTPTVEKVQPWDRVAENASKPSMTWVETDGRAYLAAPGIRVGATLNTSAAEALFAGAPRSLASIFEEAGREGGKPKGFALKPVVKIERESTSRKVSGPNVLAVIPGSDPALANEYVLLMAHLDHVGVNPNREDDKIYNGALDNAAGVATLLEVSEAMMKAPTRPRRSILIAAVAAEEVGLLGAQYLAKHPVVGNGKVVGVVNLDMPILLHDFTDVIAFGAEHSNLGPVVARAGAGMGVSLTPDPTPEQNSFVRSDHYMFVKEGIPSLFVVPGIANGGKEKIGEFLAKFYHQPGDQMDLPINWQSGAKFAQLNYLIAREIADAPQAPRWYKGNFFGDTFSPGQPRAEKR